MNLPQLTAEIGEQKKKEKAGDNELAMLVQSFNVREDKQPYLCFLTLDLIQKEIRLENLTPYDEEHLYHYNYFGNNSAAGLQYYMTRKIDGLHYLLTSGFSDLAIALKRNELEEGELFKLLLEAEKIGLIQLSSSKGKGHVNLDKFNLIETEDWEINVQKKKIRLGEETYSFEAFACNMMEIENSANNILTIIIPQIKTKGNEEAIVLPQHPDFISVTKKEQKLEATVKQEKRMCFICHRVSEDTSSSVTSKFSRSGINKVFTTTTINASRNLNSKNFDDNYAICSDCFQNLLFGEREITSNFQSRIAGENVFVIPESLMETFDYENLRGLKKNVDLAFQPVDFEEWEQQLSLEQAEIMRNLSYVVHFVIYRTDGNSVSILETFEDVSTLRFSQVIKSLGTNVLLYPDLHKMSLGNIYGMIPVHSNKNGDQLDIQRVLSVYKALLSNHILETRVLYQYAMEAIEKGLNQLRKKNITQYQNMSLKKYLPDKDDFFIKDIIMKYLCLLKTCQELSILDKKPFLNREVGEPLWGKKRPDSIEKIEGFLKEQYFDRLPRALFYLGTLLRRVAIIQYKKGHTSKPILNKVDFQGMNHRDVVWLYQEILEKLNQYKEMKPFNESLMSQFNYYYGNFKKEGELSEEANVFYIMSGYAFMVSFPFEIEETEAKEEHTVES